MTATTRTDIAAFLTAQLDADEAAARAAEAAPTDFYAAEQGPDWDAFDARFDPARVLATVASLRAVVELHAGREVEGEIECSTCTERETFPSFVEGIDTTIVSPTAWPCSTLRALASIWKDAPGFDARWAE